MPSTNRPVPGLLAALFIGLADPLAAAWQSRGEISPEVRVFADDEDPATRDRITGIHSRLEGDYRGDDWRLRYAVTGFAAAEEESADRAFVEEAWVGYRPGPLRLRVGWQVLNWSATEAFHPADVINSVDFNSDFESQDKLGEPLADLGLIAGDLAVHVLVMPRVTRPVLPAPGSRASILPAGSTIGKALWQKKDGRVTPDLQRSQGALTVEYSGADMDLQLHYIDHMSRTPGALLLDPATGRIHPVFYQVRQTGLTLQWAPGESVIKLEAADRRFPQRPDALLNGAPVPTAPPDHYAVAVGVEMGSAHDNGMESTWIVEAQTIGGTSREERRALDIFQQDVLLGYTLNSGDTDDTEYSVIIIRDLEEDNQTMARLRYKTRLSDSWTFTGFFRLIDAEPEDETAPAGLEHYHEDHQLGLSLTRWF